MSAGETTIATNHRTLRRAKRSARRAIRGDQRKAAEAAIVARIRATRAFRAASRIGTFLAFDGEPDLAALYAGDADKAFFVPVISERAMRFAALEPGAATRGNYFGIAEPRCPRFVPAGTLDVVLTPLVAFDNHGTRVGVGRGYYDRCFANLRSRRHWFRPKLIGVAFECQRTESIAANPWDVPLWGVVTELGFRTF